MADAELRLSLDWELWVVEQLLFTGKRDDLIDVMASQGLDRGAAAEQVERILSSSGFERLRHRVGEASLAARLQRLARRDRIELVVRPDVDTDTLLQEHWIPSRPLKLTEALRSVQAVSRWSLSDLAQRFGEAQLQVNVDRGSAGCAREVERRATTLRLGELVQRILAGPSDDFYVVSRNGLLSLPAFAPLWDDLRPLPPFLVPPERPRGVSLWIGPEGTQTPAHFDPHNVLLVQVQGSKQILLAPPLQARDHQLLDGYYLSSGIEAIDPELVISVRLEPGEALFVPVAWLHTVRALAPSITLSFLCFPWPNHFHWLGPPGSDDRR